ncbi:MAG: hypothetical protein N839_0010580 [Desulfofustis sp. PB-SRB1]|jgi:hypothetical protein|nr:hypothetical protein [Desulfofustis sp. PB-SRB1]MBM1002846.1 hypothetical protein [Desulfofustis sp. PB-SRB1]HBH28949.1 hypothetical protein [Desulfofustis sp.]HBH32895.1 hypothetical protein [Desulfofustis sp.]
MHLVTGVIIAALAGKVKQNKVLQGLPMLKTGPIQVAHALPGRIRFVIPALRTNHPAIQQGIARLGAAEGIDSVQYSSISGSLTVHFNQELVPPPLLFAVIARLLGLEQELEKPITPAVIKQFRALGNDLNKMVFDETHGLLDLKTAAIAVLIVAGGKKLLSEKWGSMPTGLTLLWWAFNLINRGGGESS